jgi:hypothetical protein
MINTIRTAHGRFGRGSHRAAGSLTHYGRDGSVEREGMWTMVLVVRAAGVRRDAHVAEELLVGVVRAGAV